jgi:RHS repeat-associated protein
MTTNPGVGTYTYDAENRMTATAGVTYTYDGDGKRVKKSSGKLYWYGISGSTLLETDLNGNPADEYVFFNGKRVARRKSPSGEINYYFADHLGTSRVVSNATGAILDDSDFYPFGGERPVLSSSGNTYKFTGKERDLESGLDYFGARYYSSTAGRFLTPDWASTPSPIPYADLGDPQTLNVYSYAGNNPSHEQILMVISGTRWQMQFKLRSAFPPSSQATLRSPINWTLI